MIAVISITNSYVSIGCMERERGLFFERISTNILKTDLEYAVDLLQTFALHHTEISQIDGCAIASVVPRVTPVMALCAKRIFNTEPYIVRPEEQSLIPVRIDHPSELGANLLADAAGALMFCNPPLVFIDFGTATSVGVLNREGAFIGSVILPGVHSALNELTGTAAQLPSIRPDTRPTAIGRDTAESLTGGTVYGNAGMVDRVIEQCEAELGTKAACIATGRHAQLIVPFLHHEIRTTDYLTLKGLAQLWYAREGGRA